jgi:hypothetical protein
MICVLTPALTLTLSPGEREQRLRVSGFARIKVDVAVKKFSTRF